MSKHRALSIMSKVGILCACEKEAMPYITNLDNKNTTEYAMHAFHTGKLNDVDIVTVFSGCGKINAAIAAQQLIDIYKVDTIIFSGIGGGMTEETKVFDTVVCIASDFLDTNNKIYSDFPVMEKPIFYSDKHLCEIAKQAAAQADWTIHFGLATTGDIFTDNINPDALCIDMETAAVAHTCYMCKIPFIAIRSISDNNLDKGQEAINRNFDKASYQSYRFINLMLAFMK